MGAVVGMGWDRSKPIGIGIGIELGLGLGLYYFAMLNSLMHPTFYFSSYNCNSVALSLVVALTLSLA